MGLNDFYWIGGNGKNIPEARATTCATHPSASQMGFPVMSATASVFIGHAELQYSMDAAAQWRGACRVSETGPPAKILYAPRG